MDESRSIANALENYDIELARKILLLKDIRISDSKIKYIIKRIEIIEDQIESFREIKPFFFEKEKLKKYNCRMENLEDLRAQLYKTLGYEIEDMLNINEKEQSI